MEAQNYYHCTLINCIGKNVFCFKEKVLIFEMHPCFVPIIFED